MKFVAVVTTWTDSMKVFAEDTLKSKLNRLLTDEEISSSVCKVSKVGDKFKAEVSVCSFRAQSVEGDFYKAFTKTSQKIKSMIQKEKSKYPKTKKQLDIFDFSVVDPDLITKEKLFILDPITIYKAIQDFEKTDYPFYIFKDIEHDGQYCALYKREDGSFGLIRCR